MEGVDTKVKSVYDKLQMLGAIDASIVRNNVIYRTNNGLYNIVRVLPKKSGFTVKEFKGYKDMQVSTHFIYLETQVSSSLFLDGIDRDFLAIYKYATAFLPCTGDGLDSYVDSEVVLIMSASGMSLLDRYGRVLRAPKYPLNSSYNLVYDQSTGIYSLIIEDIQEKLIETTGNVKFSSILKSAEEIRFRVQLRRIQKV